MSPFGAAPGPSPRDEGAWRALRRRRRRRRARQTAAWSIVGLLVVGGGLSLAFGWRAGLDWVRENTRLLEVRQVVPEATEVLPPWGVADQAGVEPGDDILEISPTAIEYRLEQHPAIAAAAVSRRPDGTVRLEVSERTPIAIHVGETAVELDPLGVILGPAPAPGEPAWPGAESKRGVELPILSGVDLGGRGPGDRVVHPGARRALAFLSRMRAYGFDGGRWISEIRAEDPNDLVVYTLNDGLAIRIGDGRMSRTKLGALFNVLARIREDNLAVQFVDLRFHNQVVVRRG